MDEIYFEIRAQMSGYKKWDIISQMIGRLKFERNEILMFRKAIL